MSDRDRVQQLLWRANLGATPAQVDAALALGYAAAVEQVLGNTSLDIPNATAPALAPWPAYPVNGSAADKQAYQNAVNARNSADMAQIQPWWCNQMYTRQDFPLQEHLALFWHNHFSTGNDVVQRPPYMLDQNQTFRQKGMGTFLDLFVTLAKGPAMMVYLDNKDNVKSHPNENFARESMELFSMGIGNYTETDVREAARACTGWTLADNGTVAFDPTRFDSGSKTILGQTGNFNLDSFCALIVGQPATTKYISRKLFQWFVADDPSDAELAPMIAAWSTTGGEIRSVLRAMFTSDAFNLPRVLSNHLKNPVQWLIGALRGLHITTVPDAQIQSLLVAQGITLFVPPNVGGWPSGPGWISPTNQILRFNQGATVLGGVTAYAAPATDAWVGTLVDALGGLPIPPAVRALLVGTGSIGANSTNGQRLVAQVILAGPEYQAS